jgi:hypothetical protein
MITLTPAAEAEFIERAAKEFAALKFARIDPDELDTLELSTAAHFLGIPIDRAAKVLPVVELGPRSRRVRIADYKAYVAKKTKPPTRP